MKNNAIVLFYFLKQKIGTLVQFEFGCYHRMNKKTRLVLQDGLGRITLG